MDKIETSRDFYFYNSMQLNSNQQHIYILFSARFVVQFKRKFYSINEPSFYE